MINQLAHVGKSINVDHRVAVCGVLRAVDALALIFV